MTLLRTALVVALLNLPIHAQGKTPSASDSSAAIVAGGVAVYATLTNPTMYDSFVQSGMSAAGKVELREGDKVTNNITIPAYGSVELTASGPFVLLKGISGEPKAGDEISVTLVTDGGDKIALVATIK